MYAADRLRPSAEHRRYYRYYILINGSDPVKKFEKA
jgi:hypothetical protein